MTLEPKGYPLDTQIGRFDNEKEVEEWLLTNEDVAYPHEYAAIIKDSTVIYSPQIAEYLLRYKMQKQYNIYSYSQVFEEIPADWIDLLPFMDMTIAEALKEKERLGR